MLPATVPAGANGITLTLIGTLPTAQTQAQGTNVQTCFYTGFGDASAISQGLPTQTTGGYVPLQVPASVIQGVPAGNFTASNGYAVNAQVYFVPTGQPCTGGFDATLTNSFPVPIVEPTLGGYVGPTTIPVANTAAGTPAPPPSSLTLTGSNFAAGTTVTFGTFGSVAATVLSATSLNVATPAGLASSAAGTSVSLGVCVPGAGTTTYCSAPATPITLTVNALISSSGTVIPTPSPVSAAGQTTLTAKFSRGYSVSGGGAPSGVVNFTADGATVAPAPLVLDTTANFAEQRSSLTVPSAATPLITPVAGSYTSSQTVTMTDATAGATIYYTQDGSTPTTDSTLYTGPFTISSTQTIQAIAAAPGVLNSAVAIAAYVVTISPPTHVIFLVQPVTTPTSSPITPAVQVALEDVNGVIVSNATNAVTIAVQDNPGDTSLSGTTTVNAVNGIATFSDLSLSTIANGYTLAASSVLVAGTPAATVTSSAFNITPYPITLTLQSALIGIGSTLNGTFTLGTPAQQGGVVVTLSSSAPANVTVTPATVTVAAGQTAGSFTYTGVAAGDSTISASAANYLTATAVATGTAAQVSLGTIPPIAPAQTVSLALSLAMAAPPGGTTVTFTSSNTGVATVTSNIFIPAGQRTASANPQVVGVTIGSTVITASAPGYAPATRPANVTVVATFNPNGIAINRATSMNTTLNISAAAPAGGITFTLASDDPSTVTVPATVTILQGGTSVSVPITGVVDGVTTIRADSAGVVEATDQVTVSSVIQKSDVVTGFHFENGVGLFSLPTNPPVPVTVTITSDGPAIATISSSGSVIGGTTLVFPNITSRNIPGIYVQGESVGATTITASAPGYTSASSNVSVRPSGFVFYFAGDFSTTAFSGPSGLHVAPYALNASSLVPEVGPLAISPGHGTISVPVTSSATTIGTITNNPLVYNPSDGYKDALFQPSAAGSSTILIGTPAGGFSTPSSSKTLVATVTTPATGIDNPVTGINLTTGFGAYLAVAPPNPVTVTVTVANPVVAVISTSVSTVGQATLTFPNFSGTGLPTLFAQGLSVGTTTVTISAPGYTSTTGTLTVKPSGFVYYFSGDFSTTTFSSTANLNIAAYALNASTLSPENGPLPLNAGHAAVNVPVTSSSTSVGTITTSPVVFHPGDNYLSTSFQPVGAGTSTIAIGTPAPNFSTPSTSRQLTATVTAPTLQISSPITGVGLQNSVNPYIPVNPPNPVTVTISVASPGIAVISSSPTAVGAATLTFPNVSTNSLPQLYVQGLAVGSTTLTISAPGFTSGTSTVVVRPSGFTYYFSGDFSTTSFSGPSGINVAAYALNATSLSPEYGPLGLNAGHAAVNVPITSSAPSVGTITSPFVFHPGDSYLTLPFQPVAAGSTTVAITQPAGFSTPPTGQQLTVTVTAPTLGINNVTTGLGLLNTTGINVPVAPPNPVTVTVVSNGPGIATLSTDPTVAGTSTLSFPNYTGGGLPTIYVQGQSVGSTTLTVSAAGYNNGIGSVSVLPSGYVFFFSGDFTTNTAASPSGLNVASYALTQGTLIPNTGPLSLNPGHAPVSVVLTLGTPTVGTITPDPVIFNPGDNSYKTPQFQPLTVGTSTISIQAPAGFSLPSQSQQLTVTVQAP